MSETTPTPTTPVPPTSASNADDMELTELFRALPVIVPPLAEAYRANAKEETGRHKLTLRYWTLPFFILIGAVACGVFWLAGSALQAGKEQFAQTLIGYFLTYLGGIGTGQLLKGRGSA